MRAEENPFKASFCAGLKATDMELRASPITVNLEFARQFKWIKLSTIVAAVLAAGWGLWFFRDVDTLLRIVLANIFLFACLWSMERFSLIFSLFSKKSQLVARFQDNQLSLQTEKDQWTEVSDLVSIRFESASFFRLKDWPHFHNHIFIQTSHGPKTLSTKMDYLPLKRFVRSLNKHLKSTDQ